ncbi:MAG: Integrase [Thermoleophilia bacterium]|nr:Integrase [Thermoleophilia bacterium]
MTGKRRGHGEGSVFRRGDKWCGVLQVGVDADGKRIREWLSGFDTKREATAALAALRAQVARGEFVRETELSVEAFLHQWLQTMKRTVKATTWSTYEGDMVRHVIPRIGSVPLSKVTGTMLDRLFEDLLISGRRDGKGGLSPKTVRGVATTLGKALDDAARTRLIARSPRIECTPPRPHRRSRAAELSWGRDELAVFLASWEGTQLYAYYRLAATTGMRRGEILGLRWDDIDEDAGAVALVREVVVAGKSILTTSPKSGRGRRIKLDTATLEALQRHRAMNQANADRIGMPLPDDVFVHPDGTCFKPHWVSKRFRDRRRELGLPDSFRLHDSRHLSATLAMQAGTPLKVVSERLGHSSIMVTADVYSHVTEDMQGDAAERLAALLDAS